jgi:hypothetical protein
LNRGWSRLHSDHLLLLEAVPGCADELGFDVWLRFRDRAAARATDAWRACVVDQDGGAGLQNRLIRRSLAVRITIGGDRCVTGQHDRRQPVDKVADVAGAFSVFPLLGSGGIIVDLRNQFVPVAG